MLNDNSGVVGGWVGLVLVQGSGPQVGFTTPKKAPGTC